MTRHLIDWPHRDSLYAALNLLRTERMAYLHGRDVFDDEVQRVTMVANRVLIRLRQQIDEVNDRLDGSGPGYYMPSKVMRIER